MFSQGIQQYVDNPLAGILINAHGNGLCAQTAAWLGQSTCLQEKAYFALVTYVRPP